MGIRYYYEVDEVVARNKNLPMYFLFRADGKPQTHWGHVYCNGCNMRYMANRVWREDSSGVAFVKNRFTGAFSDVDMKEFMWIKLKC